MKNILIISGHTNLAASVANKTILETLNERLPEAELVKLDELYPDFKIDVEAEQQKLLWADIIVLQFPLFWYSAPSILERWKKLFVTAFHTAVPETSSRARNSFSLSQREHPKRCIAVKGPWATRLMNFCHATRLSAD